MQNQNRNGLFFWSEVKTFLYAMGIASYAARRRLDERLNKLGALMGQPPASGWVHAIRHSLGMTGLELAMRMGVSQSRISQIERSEIDGSLQLRTLQRVAEALNCRLHYVLVPQVPLDSMVRKQAEFKATIMVSIEMTKAGVDEDGPLPRGAIQEQVDDLADVLSERRGLWSPMFSFRSQRQSSADCDADTSEDGIMGIDSEAQAPG